jgi:pimeloyl-ACP methyl ester carboxylesterase
VLAPVAADASELVWPSGLEFGQIAVAGGSIAVAMAGSGPPLILLHGWTMDWRMWLPQVETLARDFFLVMPDRRGFGRSTAPPDLAGEADDVMHIADFLGFDRLSLLGLSQGAAIALDCAHQHGWRLASVIASGAPVPKLVERDEVIHLDDYEAWARAGEMEKMRAHWAGHALMRHENPLTSALVEAILSDYKGRDLLTRSVLTGVPRYALEQLAVPLLALTGSGDSPWRRACARALADAVPRGSHALIDRAGHLANLDNPAEFNRIVRDFLLRRVSH